MSSAILTSKRTASVWMCALLAWTWLGAGTAAAQAAEDPQYRSVLATALKEFDAGNWEEAKSLMQQAHEIEPSARTFRGMGLCSYELRDYVSAERELRQSLDDQRRPLTAKQRAEIEEILGRATRFVSRYKVHVKPEAAALRVDGNPLQLGADGELALNPGTHRIEGELEGYQPYVLELRASGGQGAQDLDVTLVALTNDSGAAQEARAPAASSATASSGSGSGRLWTWVALGATGVFVASTVAFALVGQSAYDDVDKACAVGKCTRNEIDRRIDDSSVSTYQTLTNVGIALSAAAAVTTAVLFVVEGNSEPSEPRVALGAGSVVWTEKF